MRNWLLSCAILLAVTLALRLGLAKKLGPTLRYAIWLPVLVRLLLPVGIGAAGWSVANWGLTSESTQSTSIVQNETQAAPALSGVDIAFTPDHPTGEIIPGPPKLLPSLWAIGGILVGAWLLYVELRLALRLRKTRERVEGTGSFLPVYMTDAIPSPCLFGLVRPAIYLTPDVIDDEERLRHVLAHEETHFRHGDLIWSLLRGVCLAVHWFDPLVWWAAILSRRDSETACDAGAIRSLGEGQRAAYGRTLLAMTCSPGPKFFLNTATLIGSQPEVKTRVQFLVSRTKTRVAAVLAVLLIGGVAVGWTYPGVATETSPWSGWTANNQYLTAMLPKEAVALPDGVIVRAQDAVAQRVAEYQAQWGEIVPDCVLVDAHIDRITPVSGRYAVNYHVRLSQTDERLFTEEMWELSPDLEQGEEHWVAMPPLLVS